MQATAPSKVQMPCHPKALNGATKTAMAMATTPPDCYQTPARGNLATPREHGSQMQLPYSGLLKSLPMAVRTLTVTDGLTEPSPSVWKQIRMNILTETKMVSDPMPITMTLARWSKPKKTTACLISMILQTHARVGAAMITKPILLGARTPMKATTPMQLGTPARTPAYSILIQMSTARR